MSQAAATIVPIVPGVTTRDPRGPLFGRKPRGPSERLVPPFIPAWNDPPFVVIAPRRVFAAPVMVPTPLPVRQVSLRTCQWLNGDPRDRNWCGEAVAWPGCSWCRDHETVCFPFGRRPPK